MKITLWGARGSLPGSGKSTVRYGGNTSCIEVRGQDDTVLVLDAGTGIRMLGTTIDPKIGRVDILLSHLHMDHIQGLGFFAPCFVPGLQVHIWGPPSTTMDLRERLSLYLSPPLFPIRLHELDCDLILHNVPQGEFEIGPFRIKAERICHPGETLGFRIRENDGTIAYMPDHEPALGCQVFPDVPEWTSGYAIAEHVDILFHDAQFTEREYQSHIGWGHSSIEQALAYANAARVKRLVMMHHDPSHTDDEIDKILFDARAKGLPFSIDAAVEGLVLTL